MGTDTGDYEQRTISYPHPADVDGDPETIGPQALADVAEVADTFAEHVTAAVKQVRSSFMSRLLADDAALTPAELAEAWESNTAGRLASLLERSATAAQRAAQGLQDRI